MVGGLGEFLDDIELERVDGEEGHEFRGGLGGVTGLLELVDVGPEGGIGETVEEGLGMEGFVEGDEFAVGTSDDCEGEGREGSGRGGFLSRGIVL